MYSEYPLISVIMGVHYRQEDLTQLNHSINSILGQTYKNLELLICQNGSTDAVANFLNCFEKKDARVSLIDGTGACNLAQKLNRCLAQAHGSFIARMDDDDWSAPTRLERQADFLRMHPDYAIVGCWVQEIGGYVKTVRKLPPWPQISDFRFTLPFVHPALMLRRDALIAVCGYSESFRQEGCDDYDLLLRLYAKGYRGANLQEKLLDYSVTSSQLQSRPYRLFINEFYTRLARFRELGLLPGWWCWTLKPLIVGLLPRRLLYYMKHRFGCRLERHSCD